MIKEFQNTPFEIRKGQKIIYDTEDVRVYADKWPVCDGHFLFVPKQNTTYMITMAFGEALKYGETEQQKGNIGPKKFYIYILSTETIDKQNFINLNILLQKS